MIEQERICIVSILRSNEKRVKPALTLLCPIITNKLKKMNTKTKEYGDWLISMKWDYNATLRRHYPLTEFNTNPMMNNLIKHKSVNKLFFSIEQDRNDNMTHVHLLIDTDAHYSRERLAKELGVNNKAVSFLEGVKDICDIGQYVTKDFWKRTSFYDIRFK